MKFIKRCNLCNSNNISKFLTGKDRMHNLPGKYSLYRCKKCSLIFINPRPSKKELENHYPSNYYSLDAEKPSEFLISLYKIFYSGKYKFIKAILAPLELNLRGIKVKKGGKFLDVGCGSGKFLMLMEKLGMESYGVEPGKYDKKFSEFNKLKIKQGTLDNIKFKDNYFDFISLNH